MLVLTAGIFLSSTLHSLAQLQLQPVSATPDTVVRIVAEARGLPVVPLDQLPQYGTYWEAFSDLGAILPPMPWPPTNPAFVVYQMADGQFLVDNGQPYSTPQPPKWIHLKALTPAEFAQRQADCLLALIDDVQDAQLKALFGMDRANAVGMLSPLLLAADFTTNDLWLEITGFTNHAASLVIHRPWDDTNVSHDLYFTENLAPPVQWQFMMRCPYTNAVVTDLCSAQGFFRLAPATNGDLTVSTNITDQKMAQMLVPYPWVTVTNARYTGALVARGIFTNGNGCGLPLESGVILSSGHITNAIGPNNDDGGRAANHGSSLGTGDDGDGDLNQLVDNFGTLDAAVLEFDIIATNDFMLGFQYVFASEEYPEWIGPYNDPMAIFVSTNQIGTNWINDVTNNIALVLGTTNVPVSVNTINGGYYDLTSSTVYATPTNEVYYVDNHDPNASYSAVPPYAVVAPIFKIQYDAMTVLLTVQIQIPANITNHIKIAIADYAGSIGDRIYDSAVLIKAWTPCQ